MKVILETFGILQILADIIGIILVVLQPIVVPIGEVMVYAVNYMLYYFPAGNLMIYIVVFVIFVILGIIINTSPVGDKLKNKFNKFDEKHFKKYTKHIPKNAEDAFETIDKRKRDINNKGEDDQEK